MLLEVPLAGLAAERADAATVSQLRRAIDEASAAPMTSGPSARPTHAFTGRSPRQAGTGSHPPSPRGHISCYSRVLKELIEPAIVESVARDQHRQILDAIEQHKPALAEQAMREHLRYLTDLLEIVSRPAS